MEIKNIIFAGDSFTWGEGLELDDTLARKFIKDTCDPEFGYYQPKYWDIQHQGYFESIRTKSRFSSQVASHFNVMDIVPKSNGGDNLGAINFINGILSEWKPDYFSHAILNLTEEMRSLVPNNVREDIFIKELKWDIVNYYEVDWVIALWYCYLSMEDSVDSIHDNKVLENLKTNWINKNDPRRFVLPSNETIDLILDRFENVKTFEEYILSVFWNDVKRRIESIEEKRIKIFILNSWKPSTAKFLQSNNDEELEKFFNDRFIKLVDGNKILDSLSDLMNDKRYNLSLKYPWSKNQHITKEAHDLIAQSIITRLEHERKLI